MVLKNLTAQQQFSSSWVSVTLKRGRWRRRMKEADEGGGWRRRTKWVWKGEKEEEERVDRQTDRQRGEEVGVEEEEEGKGGGRGRRRRRSGGGKGGRGGRRGRERGGRRLLKSILSTKKPYRLYILALLYTLTHTHTHLNLHTGTLNGRMLKKWTLNGEIIRAKWSNSKPCDVKFYIFSVSDKIILK